jgi:hypothetical protein
VLVWGALHVAVRVARGDVEGIEIARHIDQLRRNRARQLLDQPGDDVTPRLLTETQVERLDRLLRRLVRREAGPLVSTGDARVVRLLQISLRLSEPVG